MRNIIKEQTMNEQPIQNIPQNFRQRGYLKSYNKWHWQNLPSWCYMIDLDSIEFRPNRGIVAIIETRSTDTYLNKFQYEIVTRIARLLNVPAYLVRHSLDLKMFKVKNLVTDEEKELNEGDYINFLKYL